MNTTRRSALLIRAAGYAFCVLASVLPATALAGPWTHAPGSGYLKAGMSLFRTNDGMVDGQSTGLAYQTTTWSLYGEVGIPGRLQLTAYVPYVLGTNESASSGIRYNHHAVGDMTVALDHGPVPEIPFSFGLELKFPGYDDPTQFDDADGIDQAVFDPIKFPVLGDNNIDVMPRVQLGHGFRRGWVQAAVGYRWRGCRLHSEGACEDLRDSVVASGSLGIWAWPQRIATELYVKGTMPVQAKSARTVPTEGSLYLQGKLTFSDPALRGVGVSLGVGGIPYAIAAAQGFDVSVGLSYSF